MTFARKRQRGRFFIFRWFYSPYRSLIKNKLRIDLPVHIMVRWTARRISTFFTRLIIAEGFQLRLRGNSDGMPPH
jgi:hypothetical protein